VTWQRVGALVGRGVAVYLVVVALAWVFQRRLLYAAAGRADVDPPPGVRLSQYQAADGVVVHALEIHAVGARQTVVYFHGNGEVIGDDAGLAQALTRRGFSVALVEYRGYGHSQPGAPTEAGLYADAEAVLDGLAARGVDAGQVVLWGSSLGTGVAVEMATRGRGAALVLVSPYTSMSDVGAVHLPWLPVRLLLRDRFDTIDKAAKVRVPTVVLHGTDDEVVPFEMGERVAKAIAGARFLTAQGGHHNDLFADHEARHLDEVVAALRDGEGGPRGPLAPRDGR
jgi:fermentation-respiration switch protein FrsA (DUF1100 family)